MLTAYTDESFRASHPGCYVLASALIPDEGAEELRDGLLGVFHTGRRRRRFHFAAETDTDRVRMLDFMADREIDLLTVAVPMVGGKEQARARARCLTRLAWELQTLDVHRLVLEARQENNNRKDRQTLVAARKSQLADAKLQYCFGRPGDEPLLWLPDAIAGVAALAVCGGKPQLLDRVRHLTREVTLDRE